ncbi:MAG: nuclear transport factor 2 family protein [Saprospiraceae bacterium]|nr:nuclear transport factor 2 family protein [Saprospiraceae bacterium]
MHANNQLIRTFFEAFQQKDCTTMKSLYADQATFSDPVFHQLDNVQLKGMWEMFCKRSKDLQIEFHHSSADDHTGQATWHAMYTFSPTGQGVINKIQSEFTFQDGKIMTHQDSFSFYNWARQALGWKGLLFGWTPMIQNKVRRMANVSLDRFLSWKEGQPE